MRTEELYTQPSISHKGFQGFCWYHFIDVSYLNVYIEQRRSTISTGPN